MEGTLKNTLVALSSGSLLIMGSVDATVLNEEELKRTETIAGYTIEAKQIENVVETSFPWKDQPGLKVKYDLGEPTLEERLLDQRKQEVITEIVGDFDGGFKVDILLNERPDSNRFCYQIEGSQNYEFYYQPPLTKEEIAQGAYRPPEIEGSYAVYHKLLRNHQIGGENYATGKVMHIPRPQVWSLADEANKVWADMTYDEVEGLCVTVPQAFLDKAEYPVRVDPTFGYTGKPITTQLVGGGASDFETVRAGYSQVLNANGTLDSLHFYLSTTLPGAGRPAYVAINQKDGGGSGSHSLVFAGTATQTAIATTLYTATATGETLTTGNEYVLSVSAEDPGGIYTTTLFYDSFTGITHYSEAFTDVSSSTAFSNSQESPWTVTASGTGRMYGIYATYTCSAGNTCLQAYGAPGTYFWTAPTGVTSADVACWGGGGGGGDGKSAGGSGGGGGAFASSTVAVSAGTSYPVIVGAGGANGSDGATGTDGGTSSFATTTVVAVGGKGGGGANSRDAVVSSGGLAASSTGDVKYSGGNGGAGRDAGSGDTGGGGGAAGGPNGNGGAGANAESTAGRGGGGGGGNGGASATSSVGGWSIFGGTGGNGGNATDGTAGGTSLFGGGGGGGGDNGTSGNNGGSVGGGGGGGEQNNVSGRGDGASGMCTITYTMPSGGGGGGGSAPSTDDGIFWF